MDYEWKYSSQKESNIGAIFFSVFPHSFTGQVCPSSCVSHSPVPRISFIYSFSNSHNLSFAYRNNLHLPHIGSTLPRSLQNPRHADESSYDDDRINNELIYRILSPLYHRLCIRIGPVRNHNCMLEVLVI